MNYGAGPSRPPPIPYDDPYSDSFTDIPADRDGEGNTTFNNIRNYTGPGDHANDRDLGPGRRHHTGRGRGRGGGRSRHPDRGRRGRGKGTLQHPQRQSFPQRSGSHDYSSSLTPPSGSVHPHSHQGGGAGEWGYGTALMTPQPPVFGFGLPNSFPAVQPHINPRFANQLGFNFSQMSQIPQISPNVVSPSSSEQYHPGDANSQPTTGHTRWEEGSG